MKNLFFLPFLTLLLFFIPQVSSGQSVSGSLTPESLYNNIDVSISPKYPGPEESVTIKIQTPSESISSINFNWSLDGTSVLSGFGENILNFTTGPEGSSHRIFVSLNGTRVSTSKTLDFNIGSVDLLVESQSYTHPFYEGKAFPSYDTDISVIAIPNISGISAENLYYTWKQDGLILGSSSGFGKSSLLVNSSFLIKNRNIEVLVGKSTNSVTARNSVSIRPRESAILLYEDNPLYGKLYNKTIGEINLLGKELSVVAEPYFFSSSGQYPALEFTWKINNDLIPSFGDSLTLRNEDNSTGTSRINVEAKNVLSILESAKTSSLINF